MLPSLRMFSLHSLGKAFLSQQNGFEVYCVVFICSSLVCFFILLSNILEDNHIIILFYTYRILNSLISKMSGRSILYFLF